MKIHYMISHSIIIKIADPYIVSKEQDIDFYTESNG